MSRRKSSATVQSTTTPELPGDERELEQVVRPRDEPADEAAEAQAQHVGDPLVAAERRHLAEHAVAVGLRLAFEVLRQPAGLAERVLAVGGSGWPGSPRWERGRSRRATRRVLAPLHLQCRAHEDAALVV